MIRDGLGLIFSLSISIIWSTPEMISSEMSENFRGWGEPLMLAEVEIKGFPNLWISGVQK